MLRRNTYQPSAAALVERAEPRTRAMTKSRTSTNGMETRPCSIKSLASSARISSSRSGSGGRSLAGAMSFPGFAAGDPHAPRLQLAHVRGAHGGEVRVHPQQVRGFARREAAQLIRASEGLRARQRVGAQRL